MKIICTKEYYDTGELWREFYHLKSDYNYWHREDGPACIQYYRSGQKEFEDYWQNDQHHRVDGPAHIKYSENGEITVTKWYINRKQIKPTNLMKMIWKRSQK